MLVSDRKEVLHALLCVNRSFQAKPTYRPSLMGDTRSNDLLASVSVWSFASG